MAQPGVVMYGGGGAQTTTGNPYDSGAYYGQVDYGGSLGMLGSNFTLLARSPVFNTATMTAGFGNKPVSFFKGMGRYATGLNPDFVTARKLAGVTAASQGYAKFISKTGSLGRFMGGIAPTLSHLGPAKYFTLWSALAGDEEAMQSLAAMRDLRAGAMGSKIGGSAMADDYVRTYKGGKAYKFSRAMHEHPLGNFTMRAGGPRWSSAMPGGASYEWVKNHMGAYRAGKPMGAGYEAAAFGGDVAGLASTEAEFLQETGISDGWLGKKLGGALWKNNRRPGAIGNITRGMGKGIKPIARMGGGFLSGVDVYGITSFVGSMMGKGFLGAIEAPTKMYTSLTQEMHRGKFMSSSPLSPSVGATGRQRAMANIYEKQLNLRQVIGNEAPYLANWGL